jgi:hypothetical protein
MAPDGDDEKGKKSGDHRRPGGGSFRFGHHRFNSRETGEGTPENHNGPC